MRRLAERVLLWLLLPYLIWQSWLWLRSAQRCGLIERIPGRKSRLMWLASVTSFSALRRMRYQPPTIRFRRRQPRNNHPPPGNPARPRGRHNGGRRHTRGPAGADKLSSIWRSYRPRRW